MDDIISFLKKCKNFDFIVKSQNGKTLYISKNIKTKKFVKNRIESLLNGMEIYDDIDNIWYEYEKVVFHRNDMEYSIHLFYKISKYIDRVEELQIDNTTTLISKDVAIQLLDKYIECAMNKDEEFAVLFGDIDLFKNVNDIYGHVNGDLVLREIAKVLINNTKQKSKTKVALENSDLVGRFGGEEFLIILKNVSEQEALIIAERLRKAVENISVKADNDKIMKNLTISFGVYHVSAKELVSLKKQLQFLINSYMGDTKNMDCNVVSGMKKSQINKFRLKILKDSDIALYESKKNGRNCVTKYSD